METENSDHPNVIAPPPLIFLGSLGLGLVLNRIFPVHLLPRNLRLMVGALVAGLALGGVVISARTMMKAGTPLDPRETPRTLVKAGPYRFSRNPIYLSMALLVLGIGILADALWVLALLPVVLVVMNHGVISREERYLEHKFGEAYTRYKASVRRWV